ncbi:urea transporter [Hydrogenothermus marinus]|uniref:Urea transporter n=1 Tax=Hydrogenothermus marinus TaxID=133270 RepID=A0A3M0B604_9AQUI|nr:urea transporter [Hydrogenothermus marinus]RMA92477.1 urea transporter [Hydrogenothermus marinus]
MKQYILYLKAILNSYSEILFLQGFITGAIILLSTFINPSIGIAGLISVLSAYFIARFLNMGREFLESGFYTYNALLVGLSIGYLFKITPLTIFFTIIAGILTFIFSVMLYKIFSYYLALPILSIPFVVISSILYLSAYSYSNLFVDSLYPHSHFEFLEDIFPLWLSGYFKSLGAILFLPDVFIGIIFSILLFFSSRILFLLSIIGYITGSLSLYFLTGSYSQAFSDITNFNFILIAMALGGIFLIPSIKSYFIALIGVITSTIVLSATKTFWSFYGIPIFTFPFNFTTLSFIYVLGALGFPLLAKIIRKNPEETLDYYLTTQKRFSGTTRGIYLPFSGEWTVWQGFNDEWTHKGNWKYAYDFVITDENGKTYKGDGLNLTDYYAFKKPVLSPVRGRVVKVVSNLPDNPIGTVDRENNWGNYIVIYDFRGFYVELSHFAQNSIKVKEGDWVEIGSFLGLCGNSGYSPQPHIHIQVQATEEVGSLTLPFSFISYISGKQFFSNNLPKKKEKVKPAYPDISIKNKLSFYLDNQFIYEIYKNNQKIDEFSMKVKMEIDGTFYFETEKGKLYFGKDESSFYFYSLKGDDKYLKIIFRAIPKIPLISEKDIKWIDFIPFDIAFNNLFKNLILFIASFNHSIGLVKYEGKIIDYGKFEGLIKNPFSKKEYKSYVILDENLGFKEIKIDSIKFVLKKINYGG